MGGGVANNKFSVLGFRKRMNADRFRCVKMVNILNPSITCILYVVLYLTLWWLLYDE